MLPCLALVAAACTSAGGYPELARDQQARFAQCWANVGAAFCGPLSLHHTDCRNGYQAAYAARAPEARASYLGELGCGLDEAVAEAPACPDAACPACATCAPCDCTSGSEAPAERDVTDANDAIDET